VIVYFKFIYECISDFFSRFFIFIFVSHSHVNSIDRLSMFGILGNCALIVPQEIYASTMGIRFQIEFGAWP